jgi:hypothetical protein
MRQWCRSNSAGHDPGTKETPVKAVLSLFILIAMTGLAAAQDHVALAIEGWRQETRGDVVYYRCASDICAAGSVVSYKAQPHHPVSMAEFEAHHRGLARRNAGVGKIRDVRIADIGERIVDGVRVLHVAREVEWTDRARTYTIEARLIGPDKSFSLVSDSPRGEWTANNFEGFLRRLVDIAGIRDK